MVAGNDWADIFWDCREYNRLLQAVFGSDFSSDAIARLEKHMQPCEVCGLALAAVNDCLGKIGLAGLVEIVTSGGDTVSLLAKSDLDWASNFKLPPAKETE